MFASIEVSSCSCSSSSCSSSWSLLKNSITINFCSCYNSNATTLCVKHRIDQRRIPKRQYSIDNTASTSTDPNPSVLNTTRENTIKIAIVGSGPSGCYTAKYLSKALQQQQQQQHDETNSDNTTDNEHGGNDTIYHHHPQQSYQIDIIEKLPTPYGLVRYGVAPDHPEVKNVQNDFDQLFDDNNHIHFIGNVHVGRDIHLEELRQFYSIVILCYGCDSDRKLVLPTTTTTQSFSTSSSSSHDHDNNNSATTMFMDIHHPSLPSDDFIMSAREFVAWYNGMFLLLLLSLLFQIWFDFVAINVFYYFHPCVVFFCCCGPNFGLNFRFVDYWSNEILYTNIYRTSPL